MLRFAELSSIWSMVRLRAHPSIWTCCQLQTWGTAKKLTFQGIILFLLDSRYLGHCLSGTSSKGWHQASTTQPSWVSSARWKACAWSG